mmetsp:Transcript_709/g.1749  ORF Transcript_709/g.1749 Transcript_709/m.1749 type:complete len:249 (+) Transcript_709:1676-2422(+)
MAISWRICWFSARRSAWSLSCERSEAISSAILSLSASQLAISSSNCFRVSPFFSCLSRRPSRSCMSSQSMASLSASASSYLSARRSTSRRSATSVGRSSAVTSTMLPTGRLLGLSMAEQSSGNIWMMSRLLRGPVSAPLPPPKSAMPAPTPPALRAPSTCSVMRSMASISACTSESWLPSVESLSASAERSRSIMVSTSCMVVRSMAVRFARTSSTRERTRRMMFMSCSLRGMRRRLSSAQSREWRLL